MNTPSADNGASITKNAKKCVVVEAIELSTPELNTITTTAVTTAVKTPCFISYVGSTSNSPADTEMSMSSSGSPPVVVVAEGAAAVSGSSDPPLSDMLGSSNEKAIFRNVATPATTKKVKKVRAKGVTLFDDDEQLQQLDIVAALSSEKTACKYNDETEVGEGEGEGEGEGGEGNHDSASRNYRILAIVLFVAAACVRVFAAAGVVGQQQHSLQSATLPSAHTVSGALKMRLTRLRAQAARVSVDVTTHGWRKATMVTMTTSAFKASLAAAFSVHNKELEDIFNNMI
jgi:hypothetical protein